MSSHISFILRRSLEDPTDQKWLWATPGLAKLMIERIEEEDAVLDRLERTLATKLDFLFRPNHYDYTFLDHEQSAWAISWEEKRKMREEPEKLDKQSLAAWVNLRAFVSSLAELIDHLNSSPEYYKKVDYDRESWNNYLDSGEFINDLEKVADELARQGKLGYTVLTIDME